ncbi:CA174 protein, partial [Alopecoenas beccarii]|nr:CA174 protein [Alopecoenas beccarii]
CSSHKVADRRPSKRLKCEKNSLVNSEPEGLTCESENLAALGETPKTPDGDQHSEDPGEHNVVQQGKGESVRETKGGRQEKERTVSVEPLAVKSSSAPLGTGSDGDARGPASSEEDEGSCSDGSGSEEADLPRQPAQPDNSAFLDEDSNQPMPVHRFFGDGEFLKDLPAAALPRTRMSRREFRKLHFIAKEDEEEEEEDV